MLLVLFKRFISKISGDRPSTDSSATSPEETIEQIRRGDEQLRAAFIAQYEPYILKVTSRFCKRYIDPIQNEEYSVALIAFNEAIDGFNEAAGRSFLGFAETVIRRRLIDYVRKEQRHWQSVPYSAFDREDEDQLTSNPIETAQAMHKHEQDRVKEDRKQEIQTFAALLGQYGISFSDLADQAPKHADTRGMLFAIGKLAASDPLLYNPILEKGRLPVSELAGQAGVSRKTIERNRKYIMALVLLVMGEYPYLRAYITHTDAPQVSLAGRAQSSKEVKL
ncbi:RNA polymerase sigma factor SigI [Paenibacillus sp. MMS18-CY102]|nr:RNA polymerase sigma factor SigI [Paenibacillus sp. MMS18-CY102]